SKQRSSNWSTGHTGHEGMRIVTVLALLTSGSHAFFFRPCNCNNHCEDYNPCPIPPVVCPEPHPCPAPFAFNAYPTPYNSYAMPNFFQPQQAYYAPAYNTYSTGYSSQPHNWYQAPSYPSPQYPGPAYPQPNYGSYPSITKTAYPSAKLPELTPLPTISQPDDYSYTANKIYRPVPEAVPASTIAYEKPDEVIELENTDTDYYPRMDKVTVEPYTPVSEYDKTTTGYNQDHSTEVGDYEYKNIGGGTTPVPYQPPEPTNDSNQSTPPEVGPTPSGYDSNPE
ncbi:hypothetical protein PENTCL1PPCAC_3590, partial [Pristionchus entomophagus]